MSDRLYPLTIQYVDTDTLFVAGFFSLKMEEGDLCQDCNEEGYATGVLISELLNGPGPHPPDWDGWVIGVTPDPM